MDLDSYQTALEEVLTWLLSAEDTSQEQEDISEDMEEVKEQFATHEVSHLWPVRGPCPPRCLCLLWLCPDVCASSILPCGKVMAHFRTPDI